MSVPVTALVIAKNEERAIAECLKSLAFCDQVIVIDSNSTDRTREISKELGADVVFFEWNGRYPKKKQWAADLDLVRNRWVLHMDADERVSEDLQREIATLFRGGPDLPFGALEIPLEYWFAGRKLRFGHQVYKRSLCDTRSCRFEDMHDDGAPGITEVEGHYQPRTSRPVARTRGKISHIDPDPIATWVDRHNRYSDWEAFLRTNPRIREEVRTNRTLAGRIFDRVPLQPIAFFIYAYFVRRGILDGRAGLGHALGLSFYYWLIDEKTRERTVDLKA